MYCVSILYILYLKGNMIYAFVNIYVKVASHMQSTRDFRVCSVQGPRP